MMIIIVIIVVIIIIMFLVNWVGNNHLTLPLLVFFAWHISAESARSFWGLRFEKNMPKQTPPGVIRIMVMIYTKDQ